ncbi:MAG: DEAD/DEAH box helicase family protein [Deltaproteobacteria bacterium]|nr:DEAD/DEAH box helicase family protein [Deltaproteobacteria bacterium]
MHEDMINAEDIHTPEQKIFGSSFAADIKFKYPWRAYQARVLQELEYHLKDDRLHVVAPPGSGKTVLGLEVMRRLGHPALILAPTVAIKHQWLKRFNELFLSAPATNLTSTDISAPKLLTALTYQELHTKMRQQAKDELQLIASLQAAKVQTIVLDEAHHLRKAWWDSLISLVAAIKRVHIVSLTATPPYDVDHKEWSRYIELCGPIDAQISIPELVAEKNLAPHQDLISVTTPIESEANELRQYRDTIKQLIFSFPDDNPEVIYAVSQHPWIVDPLQHVEEVLESPDYFSAMLVFLKHWHWQIPAACIELLGGVDTKLPAFDLKWAETLWHHILLCDRDRECFVVVEEILKKIEKILRRLGAIERRNTNLSSPSVINKVLLESVGKLEAITEITKIEWQTLGVQLRAVVLADNIRAEVMPAFIDDIKPLEVLGVVPIFERLRREYIVDIPLGVLTGSLVIIPATAAVDLQIAATLENEDANELTFKPLAHDPNYLLVSNNGGLRKKIVTLVTALFREGHIKVLVGTAALLGEGWDAPSVNTLVLASEVGSFVLCTQMRGRAIRIDPRWMESAYATTRLFY